MVRALPILAVGVLLAAAPEQHGQAGPIPVPRLKPSLDDLANFAQMPVTARAAMLQALADRLAARLALEPEDVDAWLRLGQARLSLDQRAAAVEAFEQAAALSPTSPSVLKAYAAALVGPPDPASGLRIMNPRALSVYRRISRLDPADPEPYWYVGLFALQIGDHAEAVRQWQVLLQMLDPADPDHAALQARLKDLAPSTPVLPQVETTLEAP